MELDFKIDDELGNEQVSDIGLNFPDKVLKFASRAKVIHLDLLC